MLGMPTCHRRCQANDPSFCVFERRATVQPVRHMSCVWHDDTACGIQATYIANTELEYTTRQGQLCSDPRYASLPLDKGMAIEIQMRLSGCATTCKAAIMSPRRSFTLLIGKWLTKTNAGMVKVLTETHFRATSNRAAQERTHELSAAVRRERREELKPF